VYSDTNIQRSSLDNCHCFTKIQYSIPQLAVCLQ